MYDCYHQLSLGYILRLYSALAPSSSGVGQDLLGPAAKALYCTYDAASYKSDEANSGLQTAFGRGEGGADSDSDVLRLESPSCAMYLHVILNCCSCGSERNPNKPYPLHEIY